MVNLRRTIFRKPLPHLGWNLLRSLANLLPDRLLLFLSLPAGLVRGFGHIEHELCNTVLLVVGKRPDAFDGFL